jgi:hypothetical protein
VTWETQNSEVTGLLLADVVAMAVLLLAVVAVAVMTATAVQ